MIIKGNTVGHPLPDPRKGLSMEGPIHMHGNRLNGIAAPENLDDAVNLSYVRQTLIIRTGSATLPADGWVQMEEGFAQTVTAEGVAGAEQCHVLVNPMAASFKPYREAAVFCTAQGEGTLTFTCEELPETDLFVSLILFGGYAVAEPEVPMLSLIDDESGSNVQAVVGDETYGVGNATVNRGAAAGNYDFTVL